MMGWAFSGAKKEGEEAKAEEAAPEEENKDEEGSGSDSQEEQGINLGETELSIQP